MSTIETARPETPAAALGPSSHFSRLESEATFIIREAVAEAQNPVMLFSAGKDSTVMAHLAVRFLSKQTAFSASACRFNLGVSIPVAIPG